MISCCSLATPPSLFTSYTSLRREKHSVEEYPAARPPFYIGTGVFAQLAQFCPLLTEADTLPR